MSLNFHSQNTFINRLLPVGSPARIRFNGSHEAVSDIEYLVGKHCFGFDLGAGASVIDAILLLINCFRERHYLLHLHAHELLSNYESPLFSEVARRNGLNMTRNRPDTTDQSIPPLRHIPYLLDSFYSNPPTQPRYRIGVATRCWNNDSDISSHIADVAVDYFTGDDADKDEYHTIWIINDNGLNLHGSVDTWSALVCCDGNDVQTLLQNKFYHRETSFEKAECTTASNQRSIKHIQGRSHNSVLSPYAATQTDPSRGIQPKWPEPSINLERGYNIHSATPERIPGAPPFETSLPILELANCTMEELLTYYPEHVLHWPGLAILYNHYRFRLTNSIFEDTFQYVKTVRGDHIDISKRSFRRATKRTGMQILNGYDAGSFDGHMQPLSEAVQASGQSLEAFLESILWTTPKGIALQPVVPLSDVGSTVLTHPVGQFSSRVVAAMQNQTSPHPPNKHGITSLPIIKRCLHGSPEVDETMRETISLNYYPVHLPEKFVIQHYYAQLIHEPLLYVLIKYSGNAIAHMVPAEVCPDQTHAGFKTFAAKLRKRQQMALGQRGERREILWKGMTKIVYGEAYGKLKKEYQEERICGGYGGVRAPAKRKDYEEEEENENEDEDETSRPAPSGKRRRTKKGKFGGQQGMNVMNAYATSRPSTYGGTHLPTPSFLSTLATPSMQRTQIPWAAGITQQELGFHAPTTFQNNPPSRTFTAARLNTGLESVYDRPAAQYYDQQIGSSGQQPTFQGPNYNTFDFSAGDDPQYHSTSDLFGHSQYDNPQPSNGVGENDMGFNSFPRNHDAAPQFIHPSIKGNIVEEEHFGEDAIVLPEITLEDWDQMINFENYGHQHTPTTVSITPIALNDLANSAVQFPPPYPNPNIHHATEPQYPTIPIPTPPHLSNTEISQVSPQPPPPNQYREPSFQSAPHKSPPYQQEQERYESIPPPSIDDNEIYGGETTPTNYEDLIDEFYATNADVDIHVDINIELEPPSKATSDKEHHGSNDAINAGNIGKWFNATQHPDETISNNETIPQTNLDNPMEREGKKRNASITSTDSLASLFGEETGR